MGAAQRSMNVENFTIFDMQTWLPVYGNWCGPGWSAGQRDQALTIQQMRDSPVFQHPNGQASVIDAICKEHDIAYAEAEGQANESVLVALADIALLRALMNVNFLALPQQEVTYATLMAYAFFQKSWMINLPRVGVEALWAEIQSVAAWVQSKLDGINGLMFTDVFGQTMIATEFTGNTEGLAYAIKSVTSVKPDGHNAVFTQYRDGYQSSYSGFDSAYDPLLTGAFLKVWIDGTISLIEGDRHMQLSTPSVSGIPTPPVGSVVVPIGGIEIDPNAAQFLWNGLYVFDGTQWTRGGDVNFDAWVCTDNQCVGVPKDY
jgi:hypothetical protein